MRSLHVYLNSSVLYGASVVIMALFLNARAHPKVYQMRTNREEVNRASYHRLFRFNKEHVEWLAGNFLPENNESRGGCLSPVERMETTLRYLADPGFQTSVAKVMGITQPTACTVIADTLDRISAHHETWIKFPTSNTEVTNAKQQWAETLGFPYTLGAIDCTHVRINKPGGQFGDDFINRKDFPSYNVQATCNEKWALTSVDVGWPVSVHDSRIFQTSAVYDAVSRNLQGVLLGDSGYGKAPYMITPFSEPSHPIQNHFNKLHKRNRVVVEQSFGQLKQGFPILRFGIRLKLENVSKCIMSCFDLHNIAKNLNDPFDDFHDEDAEQDDDDDDGNRVRPTARQVRQQGQQKRDEIAILLFNERDQ
ncbi:putative nuclease HARBI1 [Asterias amurensis]|uniref:putative nuclease HARBI1 n=1 Tax=Asterias amurensis TaxID=7602 RepID=UPI003AB66485